jgi:hypothetical protein
VTSYPKNSPVGSTPRSSRGQDAADSLTVHADAAVPDAPAPTGRGVRGTTKPTGGGGHPPSPSVARPVPVVSGAEGGRESPPVPARAPAAAPKHGGRGTPSRPARREGDASPGSPVPGLAPTSPRRPEGTARGARDEEAGVRTLRASLPPAISPAGGAPEPASALPAGTTGLSGKAFRDAVKAAQSAQAKAKRNGRGRYPARRRGDGYGPGMSRRPPPGDAS